MKKKDLSLVALLSAALWFTGCQPQGSPEAMKKIDEQDAKIESMEKRVDQLDSDLKALSAKFEDYVQASKKAAEKATKPKEESKSVPRRK
ncbi:hypothetical protein IIA15_09710 [candidate division TA06 bacterium]|nr:hypothetical protein [candidate division TA06 bacterium]